MDAEIIFTIIEAVTHLDIMTYVALSFCAYCLFLIVKNLVRGDF